jgi:hypothetical protein
VYDANPAALTIVWYGLNGTLVIRKLPSLPVIISRLKPLTGFETSTFAPATTPPDASFTTPSIDPEFPNCALAGIAPKQQLKMNARNAILRKLFNMISPCLYGHFYWVDQGR